MPIIITNKDVVKQSEAVWGQFGETKWLPFAKENAKLSRRPADELRNSGVGKFLVVAAMGESLEESVEIIKKNRDKVDVMTCDKGFGALLEHGVKADIVMVCDCNILYHWVEKYREETKDVKLISTVYGNPVWTSMWKGPRYFYMNRDAIRTEEKFKPIFGNDMRTIPASTNVSNAMAVFMTGCDENSNYNWAGYEKYLLTGYDYSWRPNGNYYAWSNPVPKRYYMAHRTVLDIKNDWVLTSENLWFSVKWAFSYFTTYGLPVVNCSERGLLFIPQRSSMEKELGLISGSKKAFSFTRAAFETARMAREAFELSKKAFDQSREGLYQWQSATKQN